MKANFRFHITVVVGQSFRVTIEISLVETACLVGPLNVAYRKMQEETKSRY